MSLFRITNSLLMDDRKDKLVEVVSNEPTDVTRSNKIASAESDSTFFGYRARVVFHG